MHIELYKYKTFITLILSFVIASFIPKSFAQEQIRIMSYNLNDYRNNTRDADFRTVINDIQPDIIVGIELHSSYYADVFLYYVLNYSSTTYSMGTYVSNGNTDNNAIYYKTDKFNFDSTGIVINSGDHPTYIFTLQHISTGEQLTVFGVHLSSSAGPGQRTIEAGAIRAITNTYVSGEYFIAAGDFNFGSGTETAFRLLLATPNNGKFIDAGGYDGYTYWGSDYKLFSFDTGGSTVEARYDLILNSQSVVDDGGIKYNGGTFKVKGNGGNANVTPSYYGVSDHLPVYADYTFGDTNPVELVSFTGVLNDNRVDLYWGTATEVNNYGFNIERSSSLLGTTWETIGFVEGHGNSNSPKEYGFTDTEIEKSGNHYYRLKQIDNDGEYAYSDIVTINVGLPDEYYLSQNYPNPFNPETKIDFTLPEKQQVRLRVYNTLGELVRELVNEQREAGSYTEDFNASDLPSGVYIYRLETPTITKNNKMILLK